jgi:hypothetical protein
MRPISGFAAVLAVTKLQPCAAKLLIVRSHEIWNNGCAELPGWSAVVYDLN